MIIYLIFGERVTVFSDVTEFPMSRNSVTELYQLLYWSIKLFQKYTLNMRFKIIYSFGFKGDFFQSVYEGKLN